MSTQLITALPSKKLEVPEGPYLRVAEYFTDTIQGEGITAGVPSTFLRLQKCTLDCKWCDTTEVWRKGNPYSIKDLVRISEVVNPNHNFVLTGGSPLLQQDEAIAFLSALEYKLGKAFPLIEIENECVKLPSKSWEYEFYERLQWNNSPKLSNSGMRKSIRYSEAVIGTTALLQNSWFKFVVSTPEDIEEIKTDFLQKGLIFENQIILQPQGASRIELEESSQFVVEECVKNGWRYGDRLHIRLWDKKTGV